VPPGSEPRIKGPSLKGKANRHRRLGSEFSPPRWSVDPPPRQAPTSSDVDKVLSAAGTRSRASPVASIMSDLCVAGTDHGVSDPVSKLDRTGAVALIGYAAREIRANEILAQSGARPHNDSMVRGSGIMACGCHRGYLPRAGRRCAPTRFWHDSGITSARIVDAFRWDGSWAED